LADFYDRVLGCAATFHRLKAWRNEESGGSEVLKIPGTGRRSRRRRSVSLWPLPALAFVTCFTLGCAEPQVGGERVEAGVTDPTAGTGSDLLGEVMEADRAFARAVAREGLEAWVAAFSKDGSMIPASGPVTSGHEAIRATMEPAFETPGFTIEWEPLGGEVATSGDLAYTYGDYESGIPGALTRGRYVTVWRRSSDGEWKVVADLGNREQSQE
jgi:ketosteroid isomerase-like protein